MVEDWEQFFVEKSRRRANAERQERRRAQNLQIIGAMIISLLIVAGLIALAAVR